MINGAHVVIYSKDAEADRAALRPQEHAAYQCEDCGSKLVRCLFRLTD
jgi:ribosomal protein L37AE/L43A